MRIVLVLFALALAGVVAACSGGGHTQSAPAHSDVSRGTVVGIFWHENEGVLRRFDRTSLTPTSGLVELGHNGGAWSFSPGKSKVAVAGGGAPQGWLLHVPPLRLARGAPPP